MENASEIRVLLLLDLIIISTTTMIRTVLNIDV